MEIRKVKKSDNQLLADIIKNVFEEHHAPREGTVYSDPTTDNLYGLFKKEKSVLWVAEENGKILGCCGIYPTEGLPGNCAELVKFYLTSGARGKGTGSKLMERNIQSAIGFGYSQLYLESLPQFSNAVKWYEKLGFQKLETPLGNSGHITCNIWMIKKLLGQVV
ncbi:GNAT family N-acetyltransferase [Sinomicrobium weinanense]|uniref:GNAT family N-acetyltransferase n=1 Tax=Sinomicrobium weinanense TaxID=2842200 RepID=A0A926Q370_9FLAO|nr:GNAT family N-acetyltransferase [Sinomicrobium weinanense]MBC9797258.1 GNAT family N-acetyltransferase [Sinomicrobium weinanense]MBU3122340.1 GNAT family N-acetyltransferase [Sinomicrobium weinanense]